MWYTYDNKGSPRNNYPLVRLLRLCTLQMIVLLSVYVSCNPLGKKTKYYNEVNVLNVYCDERGRRSQMESLPTEDIAVRLSLLSEEEQTLLDLQEKKDAIQAEVDEYKADTIHRDVSHIDGTPHNRALKRLQNAESEVRKCERRIDDHTKFLYKQYSVAFYYSVNGLEVYTNRTLPTFYIDDWYYAVPQCSNKVKCHLVEAYYQLLIFPPEVGFEVILGDFNVCSSSALCMCSKTSVYDNYKNVSDRTVSNQRVVSRRGIINKSVY